jgi:hypothetical protein
LVRMRNSDVLPACGRPMMPVFISNVLAAGVRRPKSENK